MSFIYRRGIAVGELRSILKFCFNNNINGGKKINNKFRTS